MQGLCMEAVVTDGTAKEVFKDFPFPVAGKTGTAHVADGVHEVLWRWHLPGIRSLDTFLPMQPEYTCIVVIKTKPHAAIHFGAQLAAPVFKEIATKLYAQYVHGKKSRPMDVQLVTDSSNLYVRRVHE
jgi:cell division protein FtsI (penicillin-binding protein 3)